MKQNKLVIVVLVIVAVLFVLGLNSGFFRDKEDDHDTLTMSKAQFYKKRWVASLEGILSPMRDKLDMGRLTVPGNCKKENQSFKLTKQMPACVITIKGDEDASVQKAVLSVKPANARLRVAYPADEPCAPPTGAATTRGGTASTKKLKTFKTKPNFVKVAPGRIQGGQAGVLQALTLDVVYTPAGESPQSKRCVVADDIDLVVLDKGGTLRLECKGCEKNKSITVALE